MTTEDLVAQNRSGKSQSQKPKQFIMMAGLVGVHAALSFVNYSPSSHAQLAAAIIVSVWMVYFFWRQNIWARRLVLITATLTFLVELPEFTKWSAARQAVTGVHLVLAAFLLYWLNTRSGKSYFNPAPPKADAQQVT